MIIAGFGFRQSAQIGSLRAALQAALVAAGHPQLDGFATVDRKARAPALLALAAEYRLAVQGVAQTELASTKTLSNSARVVAEFGTGSLSEAAALLAAGPAAQLFGIRCASPDGMATAAIAHSTLSQATQARSAPAKDTRK